jgi:hypothetical protein
MGSHLVGLAAFAASRDHLRGGNLDNEGVAVDRLHGPSLVMRNFVRGVGSQSQFHSGGTSRRTR